MTQLQAWINQFLHDDKVHAAILLVIADFILGSIAAVKTKTFRLSYISDFAKTDLLFKLVPYLVVYVFSIIAGNNKIIIPGLDFGFIAGTVYVLIVAAWVGSILSSLATIFPGLASKLPHALTGGEKTG